MLSRKRQKVPIRWRDTKEWLRRNRAALDAYNEHVEKHGTFSKGLRSF
jgi:antitoxin CcdA